MLKCIFATTVLRSKQWNLLSVLDSRHLITKQDLTYLREHMIIHPDNSLFFHTKQINHHHKAKAYFHFLTQPLKYLTYSVRNSCDFTFACLTAFLPAELWSQTASLSGCFWRCCCCSGSVLGNRPAAALRF